jgi:L-arabinokinase
VELVRKAGPEAGLFGAKITGGGSGGTVAVLGRADAEPAVRAIATRYREESGRDAEVFVGSGPGAEEVGVVVVF